MSIHRRAQRRDANEHEIVEAVEKVGGQVSYLSRPCDLLVWFRQRHFPIEVTGITKYRKRTKKQEDELERMHIPKAHTADEVLRIIGAM